MSVKHRRTDKSYSAISEELGHLLGVMPYSRLFWRTGGKLEVLGTVLRWIFDNDIAEYTVLITSGLLMVILWNAWFRGRKG